MQHFELRARTSIDAIQASRENIPEICRVLEREDEDACVTESVGFLLVNLEGAALVVPLGDWLVRHPDGRWGSMTGTEIQRDYRRVGSSDPDEYDD